MDITQFIPQNRLFLAGTTALAWFIVGILLGKRLPKERVEGYRRPRGPERNDRDAAFDIYVGNLTYDVGERDIGRVFERFGRVTSARIIRNKLNGRSKGFGFVSMSDRSSSLTAIRELDGTDLKGRPLVVHEAKSRPRDR